VKLSVPLQAGFYTRRRNASSRFDRNLHPKVGEIVTHVLAEEQVSDYTRHRHLLGRPQSTERATFVDSCLLFFFHSDAIIAMGIGLTTTHCLR